MKKLILYYAVFLILYIPLTILTTPFFLSWGGKRSFVENAYVKFIGGPFDYSKSLWFILANSVFWFVVLICLVFVVNKVIRAVYRKKSL